MKWVQRMASKPHSDTATHAHKLHMCVFLNHKLLDSMHRLHCTCRHSTTPLCTLHPPQEVSDDEEEVKPEGDEEKEGEVEEVKPEDETKEKKVGVGGLPGVWVAGNDTGLILLAARLSGRLLCPVEVWTKVWSKGVCVCALAAVRGGPSRLTPLPALPLPARRRRR